MSTRTCTHVSEEENATSPSKSISAAPAEAHKTGQTTSSEDQRDNMSRALPTSSSCSSSPSLGRLLYRLFRFLSPSERRQLIMALSGLLVSSATNLAFPTIMGKAIDLALAAGAANAGGGSALATSSATIHDHNTGQCTVFDPATTRGGGRPPHQPGSFTQQDKKEDQNMFSMFSPYKIYSKLQGLSTGGTTTNGGNTNDNNTCLSSDFDSFGSRLNPPPSSLTTTTTSASLIDTPHNSPKGFFPSVFSIFGIGALAGWTRVYNLSMATYCIEKRLKKLLFNAILKQEIEAVETVRSGEYMAQVMQDVTVVSKTLTQDLASALRSLNSAIGGSLVLLYLSRKLTLLSLSIIPLIGAGLMAYSKHVKRLTTRVRSAMATNMGLAQEKVNQIRTVRLFGQEEHEVDRLASSLASCDADARAMCVAEGVYMGGMGLAINSSLLTVLFVGGALVHSGELSLGNLISFALYSSMVGLGFSGLSQVYSDFVKASASIKRVFDLLDHAPTAYLTQGKVLDKVRGEVEFRGVTFCYPSRPEIAVLRNLDFKLNSGQVVALAGASGSGKTTVAALLTRLYNFKPSDEGQILLDGEDIRSLNPTWLRQFVFGVVEQEPVLFSGTILENILYGSSFCLPPSSSDSSPMLEIAQDAAKRANAHAFIEALPKGYSTVLGEQGKTQLSTGQKQRIAIARAFVRDPPILILDEATSALDGEAERQVQMAIERLIKNRTVLIIAHRPSSLRSADAVALVEDGAVTATGVYKDLLESSAGFRQIVQEQENVSPLASN